jgi:hypothetical protein
LLDAVVAELIPAPPSIVERFFAARRECSSGLVYEDAERAGLGLREMRLDRRAD